MQQDALGRPVRIKYVGSIAFGLARRRFLPDRVSKPPGNNWAQSFHKRHASVLNASKSGALDWNHFDIYDKVAHWFNVIGEVLRDPIVLQENVYNMDETGVMLSKLNTVKVLVGNHSQHGSRGARVKRTTVTAVECISADGSLQWLNLMFDPQTKERAKQGPRALICDGFGTHETLEVMEFCFENNIVLCRLPSHTSHKLQPGDISVFGPLKAAYRDQVERLERGCVGPIGKEHFTSLYSRAREEAFTSRNVRAGWAKAGLFPFNPDRALLGIPKPTAEVIASALVEITAGCNPRGQIASPHTPITPVSAGAVTSLHSLIEADAHMLDQASKHRLHDVIHYSVMSASFTYLKPFLAAFDSNLGASTKLETVAAKRSGD